MVEIDAAVADPSGHAVQVVGRRPLSCWECGFESRRGMDVYLLWECVFSRRGLCGGPITSPDESHRVQRAWVWSLNLNNEET